MAKTKAIVIVSGEGGIPTTLPVDDLVIAMSKASDENGMIGFPRTDGRMVWRRKGLIMGFDVPSDAESKKEEADELGFDSSTDQSQ